LVAEETGLVHREVFHQGAQLRFALMARQQPVIGVESIQTASLEPPLEPVLQKMRAPFVEIHAAFLVNQGLQQFVFRLTDLDWDRRCSHYSPLLLLIVLFRSRSKCGDSRLSLSNFRQTPQLSSL